MVAELSHPSAIIGVYLAQWFTYCAFINGITANFFLVEQTGKHKTQNSMCRRHRNPLSHLRHGLNKVWEMWLFIFVDNRQHLQITKIPRYYNTKKCCKTPESHLETFSENEKFQFSRLRLTQTWNCRSRSRPGRQLKSEQQTGAPK